MKILKNKNIDLILVSVISGVLLMMATVITGYISTIRSNTTAIKSLSESKVDQKTFNRFIKMFAEHSVLTEERISINTSEIDELDSRQREIELVRLQRIERNLAILDIKMRNLLSSYKTFEIDSLLINSNSINLLTDKTIYTK